MLTGGKLKVMTLFSFVAERTSSDAFQVPQCHSAISAFVMLPSTSKSVCSHYRFARITETEESISDSSGADYFVLNGDEQNVTSYSFIEEANESLNRSRIESAEAIDSPYFIKRQQSVGIGGNSGFVYDVNALKRNLIQESIRGCKQELLLLLGGGREYRVGNSSSTKEGKSLTIITLPKHRSDRDELIEKRLAALVQANPVSTTTDSNLLEGVWAFAFATNSASKILNTSRFLLSKTKRKVSSSKTLTEQVTSKIHAVNVRGGPWRFKSGKIESLFRRSTRKIFLENLEEDENAYIIDETYVLGGLFHIWRKYNVYGLTRTALDLDLTESKAFALGFTVQRKGLADFRGTSDGAPLELQILYLDTDLCICTTGLGLDGPLHVYTKSDLWMNEGTNRKSRILSTGASWLRRSKSLFQLRQKIFSLFSNNSKESIPSNTSLKALNIGELNINEDGTTREDHSWDGEDDPFYHLSPSERMEVLRRMSLQDIYQASLNRKIQNQKEKKIWGSRGKKFKRPDL